MKKEKNTIKKGIVTQSTKLHELLSGYTDEQVFSELQKLCIVWCKNDMRHGKL
jgi:hypothetical protein